jgi:hypothetical protein
MTIDGKDFVLVLAYTDKAKFVVNDLKTIHKVEARIVQSGEFRPLYAVYADAKTFKYVHAHMKGHGFIIVYKDMQNPPKKVKVMTNKGLKTLINLTRVRGTLRDIENAVHDKDPEITRWYRQKVFGIGSRYMPKTYDIFVDEGSKEPVKRRLSKDYEKFVKKMGYDPHCNACTDTSCDNVGMGDDACPAFRSSL